MQVQSISLRLIFLLIFQNIRRFCSVSLYNFILNYLNRLNPIYNQFANSFIKQDSLIHQPNMNNHFPSSEESDSHYVGGG